eukprot:comp167159_c0_seq1/m.49498 comp167159_c0_seq1/g.49498  ORF comp167159_c0_seq1/g.49498 comp167159_c0_seq1/m.49498 type:complete len:431 (-) comp167159_c0_seq1:18-1310(-)
MGGVRLFAQTSSQTVAVVAILTLFFNVVFYGARNITSGLITRDDGKTEIVVDGAVLNRNHEDSNTKIVLPGTLDANQIAHTQPASSVTITQTVTATVTQAAPSAATTLPAKENNTPFSFSENELRNSMRSVESRRIYCEHLHPLADNMVVVTVPAKQGLFPSFHMAIHSPHDDVVSGWAANGEWELAIVKALFQQLTNTTYMEGKIFVDIGANIGWYTLIALARGYRVVAFEPMPQNIQLLKHSVCLNSGFAERVTLYPFGVSTEEKTCESIVDVQNSGNGNTVCGEEEKAAVIEKRQLAGMYKVTGRTHMVKLDDYIPQSTPIGIMKIDIEGYEDQGLSDEGAGRLFSDKSRMPPYIASEVIYCMTIGPTYDCEGSRKYVEMMRRRGYEMMFYEKKGVMKDWDHLVSVKPNDVMWARKEVTDWAVKVFG